LENEEQNFKNISSELINQKFEELKNKVKAHNEEKLKYLSLSD
jgi:hypothetical protein